MSQTTDNSMPSEVPALAFELSEDERATALQLLQKRNQKLLGVELGLPVVGAVVIAIYLVGESMDWRGGSVVWILLLLGTVFSLLIVQSRRALTKAAREQPAALSVRLMNDGLHLHSAMGETKFSWHGVQGAERHADLVLVFLTNLQAVPLPLRAFASEEAADAFLGAINRQARGQADWKGPSPSPADHPVAIADATTELGSPPLVTTPISVTDVTQSPVTPAGRIRALFELALLRPALFLARPLTLRHLAVLVTLTAAAILLTTYRDYGALEQGAAMHWALASSQLYMLVWTLVLLAAGAWLAAEVARAPIAASRVLLSVAAFALPLITLVAVVARLTPISPRIAFETLPWVAFAVAVWLALVGAATLRMAANPSDGRSFLATLILLATIGTTSQYASAFWLTPSDDAEEVGLENDPARFAAGEDALYGQLAMLDAALSQVQPARNGQPDLFYLGFAGYGWQDVGAEGRTLVLANDRKAPLQHPFASGTALRRALAVIGTNMDMEQDVLFLFLTSHGARDHKFSVDMYPYRFEPVTPETLRSALDDAGIRNRVIIVSACYSGGFIDPLRTSHSVIMTAARADRRSIGCADGVDWTWFGRAYFAESLTQTTSFTKAFELAKPKIAARELEKKHEHSEPQIFVGDAIAPVLQALEQRLAQPPASPGR
jgi:hypothetical protein